MSFHRYNNKCEGWSGPHTLKIYPTFDKNDQATLKVALDERGLTFPSKHVGRGIKGFHSGERNKATEVIQENRGGRLLGTKKKLVQLHVAWVSEVGVGRSRGREGKITMEGNHPNVAETNKKRKVTSLADVRF
jgi:hypothetical protein